MVVDEDAKRVRPRILIISPEDPPNGFEGPHAEHDEAPAGAAANVDRMYCAGAGEEIWSRADALRAAPLVVEKAKWAAANHYHAAVVSCMLDPGVEAASRSVSIPVVGAGGASYASAALVGRRPANVYPAGIPIRDLHVDPQETYARLLDASRSEIDGGADVILLGCTKLNDFATRLQNATGVPVLPGERVAVKQAELLAALGIRGRQPQPLRARVRWLHRRLSSRAAAALSKLR